MRGAETEWRLRLGDVTEAGRPVLRGLEVILQILRFGDHFCGDHGASAPPPSYNQLIETAKQDVQFTMKLPKSVNGFFKVKIYLSRINIQVSQNWFGEKERIVATGVLAMSLPLGS